MYTPAVDTLLTVAFPGEALRVPVIKVVDRNTCFVRLDATPLNPAKSHQYRIGDVVAVRRDWGELGELWRAVDDRVLFARETEEKEPELPTKRRRAPAKKKPAPVKRAKAKGQR
jgi:hypothetical protein